MRGPARKGKIPPTLHYLLTLLAQGPGFYSTSNNKLVQLERRGYVVRTSTIAPKGSPEWEITEAGRLALQAYASSEAALLARPSIQSQERKA